MQIENLHAEFLASEGISTDTRSIQPGQLFFALKGENFDGNAYVAKALDAGARLVVASDQKWNGTTNVAVVPDSLEVLQELARFHRRTKDIILLGITGSNGKTTTRELAGAVLSQKFHTLVTEGNLNNHIGVPLTILRLKEHEAAVIEMGANHRQEIALLSSIAQPTLGIITNIGKAHLEGFGSVEGIRKGKGELYDYLATHSGKAFVNLSDPVLVNMAADRGVKVVPYAVGDVPCEGIRGVPGLEGGQAGGVVEIDGDSFEVRSQMYGIYNFNNIMAAMAAGHYLGVEPTAMVDAVGAYVPENNRSQLVRGKTNTLYLDAYNANPTSMQASIGNFAETAGKEGMLILGDMLELGSSAEEEHKTVLDLVRNLGFKEVMLIGPEFMKFSQSGYPFRFFPDINACIIQLQKENPSGRQILLKGSRKIAVEQATNVLKDC